MSLLIGRMHTSSVVRRTSCLLTLPMQACWATFLIGLSVICVAHGEMAREHGSTCNVGLYLYEPWHWSTCHARCFAACSVNKDRLLPERFCCWACYIDNGENVILKSSWPTMEAFTNTGIVAPASMARSCQGFAQVFT